MARKVTGPDLLIPTEVAGLFRVDAITVRRWAKTGKLRSIKTLGGHRRFYRAEVEALVAGKPLTSEQLDALVRGETW
jgi:excisionase family DNA binding protein